jgi:hypothetical protein
MKNPAILCEGTNFGRETYLLSIITHGGNPRNQGKLLVESPEIRENPENSHA